MITDGLAMSWGRLGVTILVMFWGSLGMPAGSIWGMEKAGFWTSRLTGPGQQLLMVWPCLGRGCGDHFGDALGKPGGGTLGMRVGSIWEMEKAGFWTSQLTGPGQQLLMVWSCLGRDCGDHFGDALVMLWGNLGGTL